MGSNEGLGDNVGSDTQTLYESPEGYFQTTDPADCGALRIRSSAGTMSVPPAGGFDFITEQLSDNATQPSRIIFDIFFIYYAFNSS